MTPINHMEGLLSTALWLAAIGHFCVLIASMQVPRQLHWETDLAKLEPFNRKLMWTYGAFAVFTIIAFGVMTFVLHGEMLRGDRAALILALFIGAYWLLRILVDFFYYSHEDWPKGKRFVVGHLLLTSLFVFLSASYFTVAIWNFSAGRGQ